MSDDTLVIKAVGDICPGDKSILGLGICTLMRKFGPDFPLKYMQNQFKDADIVIGNLEGVLSRRASSKQETFSGVPEFAGALKNVGFTVLNVANNHIMEKGVAGFNETIEIVRATGMDICGTRNGDDYYCKPVIINKKGLAIGILAYNWVSVDLFPHADDCIAQSHDSVVNYTWHRNPQKDIENQKRVLEYNHNVIQDIKRLKTNVDYMILVTHWGFEFVPIPPFGVTLEARSFIDVGADLIIGIHPHVLQGCEYYKDKCIVYSLGNFIFDSRSKLTRDLAIFQAEINKEGKTRHDFICATRNNSFQPVPCKGPKVREQRNRIVKLSSLLKNERLEETLNDDVVYKEFEKKYNFLKWWNIAMHFILLPKHPRLIFLIVKKVGTFTLLLLQRIRGNKIRW